MNIWNSRHVLGAVALLTLGACDADLIGSAPNSALPSAQMVSGTVALVPPRGYCIDRKALKDRFALMARCDKLGAPATDAGAPLGLITISFSDGESLPKPEDIAKALALQSLADQRSSAESVTFRAEGEPPVGGMDRTHWRGAALVAGQVMGLALYGPPGGRAASDEGRGLLVDLIAATDAVAGP